MGQKRVYVRRGVVGGRVGGQSPLKGDTPPPLRQDNPFPRLSSPHSPESGGDSCWSPSPCARLILSATSGTCETADTQIHTHTQGARTLTHTHTHRNTPAGASWRQHVDAASAYPPGPHPARPPPPLLRSPPLFRFSRSSSLCLKTPPTFPSAHASRVSPGPEDLKGRRGLGKKRRELAEGRV